MLMRKSVSGMLLEVVEIVVLNNGLVDIVRT